MTAAHGQAGMAIVEGVSARSGPPPESGSPHGVGNRLGRGLWGIVWVLLFRSSPRPLHFWRRWLLRIFGARVDATARVYPRARIWAPWRLTMGPHSCIADDVDVYNVRMIQIGANSTVSQYSYLCGATHDYEDPAHPLVPAPITIGDRVWIAADVFVGPGVSIGDGTVVGARSSVLKDLPPWVVVAGTPARVVKPRVLRSSGAARNAAAGDAPTQARSRKAQPAQEVPPA